MLVKVRQYREPIEVSTLIGNKVYCYQTDTKQNSIDTMVYDISLGTWNTVDHRYFGKTPSVEDISGDSYMLDDSEAKALATLIQGELSKDQLTQELKILGFDVKGILRLHSSGYKLEGETEWSTLFDDKIQRDFEELVKLIEDHWEDPESS